MKMIFRLLILEALVFLTFTLSAQPPAPEVMEPAAASEYAPTADDKYLLWEISGKEISEPSYLFGTIHLIPEADYLLGEEVKAAFADCRRVTFEIDTEDMMNPAAMMSMMSQMYMDDDKTVADLMSEEDYALVDAHFAEMGLPMAFLGRMKPMFLSVMVGQDLEGMKPGAEGSMGMMGEGMKSYELELTEHAKEAEMPISGLETVEFQMSLFNVIPYEAQAEMLLDAVKTANEGGKEGEAMLDQMVELYKAQDIVAMVNMMDDEEAGIGEFEDLLLLQRNRNWIPIMEKMAAEEPVFFAVGAGHLAGEEGVIALMRKAGYKVQPVAWK